MSDNDLIRRRDAINACYNGWNMDDDAVMTIHNNIAEIQAVKPPVSAAEYERALARMGNEYRASRDSDYDKELFNLFVERNTAIMQGNYEQAVAIVEKWAQEHPERSEK